MKALLALLFSTLQFLALSNSDTILIENLRYSWIQIGEEGIQPVTNTTTLHLVSFQLPHKKGGLVKICNNEPMDIWANLKLLNSQVDDCVLYPIDSLKQVLSADSIVIQIYSDKGMSKLKTEVLGFVESGDESFSVDERKTNAFINFYIGGLVLILFLMAFQKRFFVQRFQRSLQNPFQLRGSNIDEYYSDYLRFDNIFFIIYFSVLASLCLEYFEFKTEMREFESTSFLGVSASWFFKFIIILLVVLSKYLITGVLSAIFKFRSLGNVQNQDFLNFFNWIFLAVLLITFVDFSIASFSGFQSIVALTYFLVISVILFQIGIFIKTQKIIRLNKMLIISYLCTTEFLPGFVMIYFLLN